LNISLIKGIIDRFSLSSSSVDILDGVVLGKEFKDSPKLIFISYIGKYASSSGVEVPNSRVQPLSVGGSHGRFIKWGSERVEGDVDGIGVSTDFKEVSHDHGSFSSQVIDKTGKVLDPVLNEGGFDDFNLNFFKYVGQFSSLGSLLEEEGEVGSYRSVYQDGLVKILVSAGRALEGGDGSHGGFLEHTKGVALGDELVDVTATEGSFKKEHDIFNHVFIGDKVEESIERLNGLGTKVLEFSYELCRSRSSNVRSIR
jgi:hypothetical protein